MALKQTTIAKPVSYEGNGLHSGLPVKMTLLPADVGSGIRFRRTDLADAPDIPANPAYITNTLRATTLENGAAKVFTVEHVLSALCGMHITNCTIEMNSPEPPVGDGSAKTFIDMIHDAGVEEQDVEISPLLLPHSIAAYEGEKFIAALPYDGFRITYTSINPHPLLGTQVFDITLSPETYEKEIGSARTIGFTWELEAMRKMGLGKGGTLENAVVYSEDGCLSVPRWDNELVRHKILDIIGDLSLIGPMHAHIIAVMGSHKLNGELSAKLLEFKK